MPRFTILFIALALALVAAVAVAQAPAKSGEWQGSIQGLNCVTRGQLCPINMEDPLIALEKTFVLYVKDGEFYYLPNLDRAILARHLNRPVKVAGVLESGGKSILVEHLYFSRDGKWRETWSPVMERELLEQLNTWGQRKKEQ
ncbi:MAG: hypothetical protein KQH53_03900 [Desulfarculaceae bacterium]|nr:hypothetical protein [Desulfarculaceae bacterium]